LVTVSSSSNTLLVMSPLTLSLQDISDPGDRSSKQAPPPKTTPRATELSPRVALSPRCTNTLPTTSNVSWPQSAFANA
jgi:hypothetical protein